MKSTSSSPSAVTPISCAPHGESAEAWACADAHLPAPAPFDRAPAALAPRTSASRNPCALACVSAIPPIPICSAASQFKALAGAHALIAPQRALTWRIRCAMVAFCASRRPGCSRRRGTHAPATAKPMLPLWRSLKSRGLWRTAPTPVFARFLTCEKNFWWSNGGHEGGQLVATKTWPVFAGQAWCFGRGAGFEPTTFRVIRRVASRLGYLSALARSILRMPFRLEAPSSRRHPPERASSMRSGGSS